MRVSVTGGRRRDMAERLGAGAHRKSAMTIRSTNPYAAFFHSRALWVLAKPADVVEVIDSLARMCDARPLAA